MSTLNEIVESLGYTNYEDFCDAQDKAERRTFDFLIKKLYDELDPVIQAQTKLTGFYEYFFEEHLQQLDTTYYDITWDEFLDYIDSYDFEQDQYMLEELGNNPIVRYPDKYREYINSCFDHNKYYHKG